MNSLSECNKLADSQIENENVSSFHMNIGFSQLCVAIENEYYINTSKNNSVIRITIQHTLVQSK